MGVHSIFCQFDQTFTGKTIFANNHLKLSLPMFSTHFLIFACFQPLVKKHILNGSQS